MHFEKKDLCRLEKKNRSNSDRFLWKNIWPLKSQVCFLVYTKLKIRGRENAEAEGGRASLYRIFNTLSWIGRQKCNIVVCY